MFEMQFRRAAGKNDNTIKTQRTSISEYSDQPTAPAFKQRSSASSQQGRPYAIRGGFMNASIFSGRQPSKQAERAQQNYTTINGKKSRDSSNFEAVKSLKPDSQMSTYGNSFTHG